MDHPTVLLDHLSALTATPANPAEIAGSDAGVGDALSVLVDDLRGAIASYRGVQVTLLHHGSPVTLTAFLTDQNPAAETPHLPSDDARGARSVAVSSLRVPLELLSNGFEPGSRIVVYAAARGALVDLAADLTYALNTSQTSNPCCHGNSATTTTRFGPRPASIPTASCASPDRPRPLITLDTDLPPSTYVCGLSGVEELCTVERAVGVMIERGQHPDEVYATLRRQAAADQLTPHAFAVHLLAKPGLTR